MNCALLTAGVTEDHVDPSVIPLEQLAKLRGALFTARYPLPWGPRPNDPTNILTLSAVFNYTDPAERRKAFKAYTDRGYTHGAMGPWIPGGDQNYHGVYPNQIWTFDEFLDKLQELWDVGITPVVFLKPDNWTPAQQAAVYTQHYSQPRAQRLVRVCVPNGWEPSKGTSNADWVAHLKWGADVLPNALRLIHMCADFDAPGNNDDFTPGQPRYIGMAEAWRRVVPYLHGYLCQVGGYINDRSNVPTVGFLTAFANHWQDLHRRFYHGANGWPTTSAWGNRPLKVYYGEGASYVNFWRNFEERYARQLGDLAMANQADGYLDGGTVPV